MKQKKSTRKDVNFLGEVCIVRLNKYGNGRHAIQLFVKDTGEPMATASVHLPEFYMRDNYIAFKTYGGNEGLLEKLQCAGIVGGCLYFINTTFMDFPVCELLVDAKDYQ